MGGTSKFPLGGVDGASRSPPNKEVWGRHTMDHIMVVRSPASGTHRRFDPFDTLPAGGTDQHRCLVGDTLVAHHAILREHQLFDGMVYYSDISRK